MKRFVIILVLVFAAGIFSTSALICYTWKLQQHASLTSFIAGE
ncbi:MAG: hypothetical protein VZR56_00620 [Treponema sp.]|nr:hypothetical protein [Treponema sp.]